jgi:NadR type nicotinamide-nucleotide adenylyltransferase
MLKKIVAIGPESTGKSTLCKQLSAYYKTVWCPEYAREYLLSRGKKYTYDSLLEIARGQVALEEKIEAENLKIRVPKNIPYFIDTDLYVIKVWSEFVFNNCARYILDQIVERKYDLYLLCNIDLPWIQDELREYPDLETRQQLYQIYKDILVNQSTPWIEVSGTSEKRLETSIDAVNKFLIQ